MKKKVEENNLLKKSLIIILVFGALFILTFTLSENNIRLVGYAINENFLNINKIELQFIDEASNCSLNGYVFINNKLLGKSENGLFNLTIDEYKKNFMEENNISIFGKLGDCFKENKDLLLDRSWNMPEIKRNYFYGESTYLFKTNINIHNPKNRELMGFITPEKVDSYLNVKKKDTSSDLSEINNYLSSKIAYVDDISGIYWQMPKETLNISKGICNDYSTTLLSLFLAYNPSLKCYNIILTDHITTLCNINNEYSYFDQQKKEKKISINESTNSSDIKLKISKLNEEFFNYYGLNKNESPIIAFNNQEYIEFKKEEDYLNWQYSLLTKDTKSNILGELEKESIQLQEGQENNSSELSSIKPTEMELNSLKKSLTKSMYITMGIMIFSLIIIVIALYKIRNR